VGRGAPSTVLYVAARVIAGLVDVAVGWLTYCFVLKKRS
jgi:hypothetical protein